MKFRLLQFLLELAELALAIASSRLRCWKPASLLPSRPSCICLSCAPVSTCAATSRSCISSSPRFSRDDPRRSSSPLRLICARFAAFSAASFCERKVEHRLLRVLDALIQASA